VACDELKTRWHYARRAVRWALHRCARPDGKPQTAPLVLVENVHAYHRDGSARVARIVARTKPTKDESVACAKAVFEAIALRERRVARGERRKRFGVPNTEPPSLGDPSRYRYPLCSLRRAARAIRCRIVENHVNVDPARPVVVVRHTRLVEELSSRYWESHAELIDCGAASDQERRRRMKTVRSRA